MTIFLRKHFWTINLFTIMLCALLAARALGRLVEANLPPIPIRKTITPAGLEDRTISSPGSRDITSILDRNIFCSTCEKVTETPNKAEEGDQGSNTDPIKTSLNLQLIATLVSPDDQAWSFAAILDNADGRTRLYAIGRKVPGDAEITDIMERRVLLLNGRRHEYLDIGAENNPDSSNAPPPTPTPPVSFKPRGLSGMEQEVAKSIRKVGENRYEIERSALNKVLGNTTLLARSARIVPSVKNGQPNGFKLYAIRPGSLYSLLGMANGDTINAINGHAITTPDTALEVYTKLRSASHVSISFTRQNKTITNEYTIR